MVNNESAEHAFMDLATVELQLLLTIFQGQWEYFNKTASNLNAISSSSFVADLSSSHS